MIYLSSLANDCRLFVDVFLMIVAFEVLEFLSMPRYHSDVGQYATSQHPKALWRTAGIEFGHLRCAAKGPKIPTAAMLHVMNTKKITKH